MQNPSDHRVLRWPVPPQDGHVFRIELTRWLDTREQISELRCRLAAYQPRLFRSARGFTEVVLLVPGTDLWQSTLNVMVACTQAGYQPYAVEGVPIDEYERRRARDAG